MLAGVPAPIDMEHTFKLMKSRLGWTAARPARAEPLTWLLIAAYVQLRLARDPAADLRRPWERRPRPGRLLTPCRSAAHFVICAISWAPRPPAENHRPGPPTYWEEHPGPAPPPRIRTSQNRHAEETGGKKKVKSQAWRRLRETDTGRGLSS